MGKVSAQANFSPDTLIPHTKLGLYRGLPSRRSRLSAGSALRLGSGSAAALWEGTCKHPWTPRAGQGRGYNRVTFGICGVFQVLTSAERRRPLDPSLPHSSDQFNAELQLRSPASLCSPHSCTSHPCPETVPGLSPTTSNPTLACCINPAARHFTV